MNQMLFEGRKNFAEFCDECCSPASKAFSSLAYAAYHLSWLENHLVRLSGGYVCSTAAVLWTHAVKTLPEPEDEDPLCLHEIKLLDVFTHGVYLQNPISRLPLSVIVDTLYGLSYEMFVKREQRSREWVDSFYRVLKWLRWRVQMLLFEPHDTKTLDLKHLCYPPIVTRKLLFGGSEEAVTELAPNGVLLLETLFHSMEEALFKYELETWEGVEILTNPPNPDICTEAWSKLRSMSMSLLIRTACPVLPDTFDAIVHANQNRLLPGVKSEQILLQMNDALLKDVPSTFDQLIESCTKDEFERLLNLVYDTSGISYCPVRGLYRRGFKASPYLLTILTDG